MGDREKEHALGSGWLQAAGQESGLAIHRACRRDDARKQEQQQQEQEQQQQQQGQREQEQKQKRKQKQQVAASTTESVGRQTKQHVQSRDTHLVVKTSLLSTCRNA